MKVYRWASEPEDAAWLSPSDSRDFERMDDISCGQPVSHSWKPMRVNLVDRDEKGRRLEVVDCTSLGASDRALSGHAAAALRGYLESFGELLPLDCPGHTFFVYNPTCLLDALEEEASEVTYFPGTRRIMMVDRYMLRREALADAHVFKLSRDPCGFILLTERAVERLQASGCTGIQVELVWES